MPRKKKDGSMAEPTRQQMHAAHEAKKMKEEIRELMELTGTTQAQLAVILGVAESTLWRWHEGIGAPLPVFRNIIKDKLAQARKSPRPARASA